MARITIEDCVKTVPNRFELCLIASNRAKSILSGSSTSYDRKEKPPVIALREIADNQIDIDSQRQNIINNIKNRNSSSENTESIANISEAVADESESNIMLKDDTFVTENVDVDD